VHEFRNKGGRIRPSGSRLLTDANLPLTKGLQPQASPLAYKALQFPLYFEFLLLISFWERSGRFRLILLVRSYRCFFLRLTALGMGYP